MVRLSDSANTFAVAGVRPARTLPLIVMPLCFKKTSNYNQPKDQVE